ncbi:MAG: helix-turn-helix domain-containing protein [Sandaracinaceae bacterium]
MPPRPSPTEEPLAYRVPQAAALANVSVATMFRWIRAKRVPARRIQGVTLVLREDLQAALRAADRG